MAVWFPYTKKDIELIENVQRRATKQVPSLKQLSYTDRLKKLKMPTLKYRRLRGDIIETFKIINGIYDKEVTEIFFEMSRTDQTRGHSKKIQKGNCRENLRKHSFKNRVTDIWNDLPQELVPSKTVKSFAILLDKYWGKREVKYDNNEEIKIRTESHKKKFLVDIDEEIADIMVERPASIEDPKVNLVIII